jgi:hypothetical protein
MIVLPFLVCIQQWERIKKQNTAWVACLFVEMIGATLA